MIVVTGGAGFIGMNLVLKLIELGYQDIVIVDNSLKRIMAMERELHDIPNMLIYLTVEDSYLWLGFNKYSIDAIFHLGARTDTMETDAKLLKRLNVDYSKFIWNFCTEARIPLIYASSAAVYGDGEDGFSDVDWEWFRPLNLYGQSKYQFDTWALCSEEEEDMPPHWFGFRFFNVYGNHEQHKGKMASVIWHFYNQIKETGEVKLFRSHVDWCEDGEQKRDFVHVDDVVKIMILSYNIRHIMPSGIYNLGTGKARTYNDLAKAVFKSLDVPVKISYIDTPEEIRESYQYFTQANMDKLMEAISGYDFLSLEEGIDLYIKQLEDENR